MGRQKVSVTLHEALISELDSLVREQVFKSRSQAIDEAVSEKLTRLKRTRLAIECDKLDPQLEKALAEEGLSEDVKLWPEY